MSQSLDELRRSYQRTPTTRLSSLFEWDRRFATKCFQEEIHPKFSHLLKKHLSDQESKLTQFFGGSGGGADDEEYKIKIATVETFVDLCSPTDTHSGENILLGADFLVLFLAIKEFAAKNRSSADWVTKVIGSLSGILLSNKKGDDKQDGSELGEDRAKVQTLLEWALRFRSQLKRRVELESSAGSGSQLEHFHQSLDVALKAIVQETLRVGAPPEDLASYKAHRQYSIGVEPWLHLWATLGFPSDPFLDSHNTDPVVKELMSLAVEIIFLTNDVGSVLKDKKKGNQNAVLSIVHHFPGTALKDAVDVVVSMIEHNSDEFFEAGNKLPLTEADFLWYFELLKKVMRSNWNCQRKLTAAFYHGVEETKEELAL